MNAIVFLGPTLDHPAAREILPATYLPPVSLGDVYSAARHRPRAIGIVDGYFDRVPAVWHKEILWAITRGIRVYGASSMGALRAAELDAFGMIGVGRVFQSYRDGLLEDDDEVALMHGPSEFGYTAGSEAMVNMRATFAAARDQRIISDEAHERFVEAAKATFYAERDYDRTLSLCAGSVAPGEIDTFRAWLVTGRRDVKRDDAIELLTTLAADFARSDDAESTTPRFTFHVTSMWEELRNTIDHRPTDDFAGVELGLDDDVLDELRLEGEEYKRQRERSLVRLLASELGYRHGATPAPLARHIVADDVRKRHGLDSLDDLDAWFRTQGVASEDAHVLIEDEAQSRGTTARYRPLLPQSLRDHLRLTGRYVDLDRRARDKQRVLSRMGLHNPRLSQAGLSEAELWQWFFATVLVRPVPDDLEAAALDLDFSSVDLMRRAALRELLYRKHIAGIAETTANAAESVPEGAQ